MENKLPGIESIGYDNLGQFQGKQNHASKTSMLNRLSRTRRSAAAYGRLLAPRGLRRVFSGGRAVLAKAVGVSSLASLEGCDTLTEVRWSGPG